jgi:predicted metal-dependent HD superfamily phosphohydrolase
LVHGLSEIGVWAANCTASDDDVRTLKQAFWFHDFVYGGQQEVSDEEASAQAWLSSSLDLRNAETVAQLIRATDHFQEQHIVHPLKEILLGADLAILGQHADIYDVYASAIRQEYLHVPSAIYFEKRRLALIHLRQKALNQQLFQSVYFAQEYNVNAIENMTQEIERLTALNMS